MELLFRNMAGIGIEFYAVARGKQCRAAAFAQTLLKGGKQLPRIRHGKRHSFPECKGAGVVT